MKVLVTGAAGFIGTAVVDGLRERGHEVLGVDAMIPQAHVTSTAPDGVHRVDVRDAAEWAGLLRGVDVVSHQAAMVGAGVSVGDLPHYAAHNDLGTAALLAAMHQAGVGRLVLASSMVVYGEGGYRCPVHGRQAPGARQVEALEAGVFDHRCPRCARPLAWEPVTEDAPLMPRSGYAASKVAQEHYVSTWTRQAPGAAVALRYHNVYGPGMPRSSPYSGVAALFRSAVEEGQAPSVFEDGGQMRDFVHVTDVARANALAVEAVLGHDDGSFAAFNVCSGRPVSVLDVARAVARGAGGPEPVVTGAYRPGDVRHVVASATWARAELGFIARVGPFEGLPAFADVPLRT
ncbi:MAG TPA: NAD-dependent epimerase/dehydratase family protein [Nocardioidaceae bacterium]|nr:NAD-dependent epimerase/dehydratase family protein [Nocardioidaceae bacterium]